MYPQMGNEKRAASATFFWLATLLYSLSVCLYETNDIPLHIRFLKLVYNERKITSVCF